MPAKMTKGLETGDISRRGIIAMLLIGAAMVVGMAVLSYQSARQREAASRERATSSDIRDATEDLLSQLKDAETGQRGYLLTGKDEYLEPYHAAMARIPADLERLRRAAAQRPENSRRVSELAPLVSAKLKELDDTIDARKSQGPARALEIVQSDRGKRLMDAIREWCTEIREASNRRVEQYSAEAEASVRRLGIIGTAGNLLLFGFLAISAFVIVRGVVQREQLFFQARSNAELLRVTLTSIGDAVIATDSAAAITFMNPIAEHLTGWREKEALGLPVTAVFRIVNETSRATVENPLEKAIESGNVVGLANHTVLIAKDGQEVPIDDSGAPIRDETGKIIGAVLVFRDISARRATERRLKESNEQLKEFVAGAAHDLRSPLTSVSNIAQLLALRFSPQVSDEGRELLGFIIGGVRRMTKLLDDLLAYAHASHFEREASRTARSGDALQIVLENLRGELEINNATVNADILPAVAAHETHVVQLLQNLIDNALKYRRDVPPCIEVRCEPAESGWLFRVSDNGVGIAPQHLQTIFKPFRRLHGQDVPGSGIGLATCQKIVHGYGGRIWVESELGKGSTFYFLLPATESATAEAIAQ